MSEEEEAAAAEAAEEPPKEFEAAEADADELLLAPRDDSSYSVDEASTAFLVPVASAIA